MASDDDLLDNVLFDELPEPEPFEITFGEKKKKKKRKSSTPFSCKMHEEQEEQLEHEIQEDPLISKLKHPPIITQRTIPSIASSAPNIAGFGFLPNSKIQAKLFYATNNVSPNHTELFPHKESSPQSPGSPSQFDRSYDRSHRGVGCSTLERELRLVHLDERKLEYNTDNSDLNVIGYEEDDNVVVGSIPNLQFWKDIPVKQDVKQRKKEADKVKQGNAFTTISTLSFGSTLNPDTPKIVLGNPRTAKLRILFTLCVHGDEPCGMLGFNELLEEGYFSTIPDDISITAVIGNPLAVSRGVRFIEFNLNRMIRKDLFGQGAYESERARVVAHEINKCDVLLDLHSCSAKSPAHALPASTKESIELASLLPVGYVIKKLVHTTSGQATTIDWAHKKHKIGLCVECGQHDERQTIENAKNVIKTTIELQTGRLLPKDITHPPPVILESYENETVRKGFQFVRKVKAFEKVPFGEVIAVDDIVGEIKSKYESGTYIVMPTRKPVFGEEAWFNAKLSENLFEF